MKIKPYLLFLSILCYTVVLPAQNLEPAVQSPISMEAFCIGDIVSNFSGGIKRGSSYLGLANFKLTINTEELRLWKGGKFLINAANNHGGNPTADLIGDFHTVSNIESEDIIYIHELWYSQTINNIHITVGLQDLNTDYVSSGFGSIFINSTFGTPSTIADNVPSPIFPLTAIGISLKKNDRLGIAVTNAGFSDPVKRDETVVEVSYKAMITENLFISLIFNM
jgi:porin